MNNPALIPFSHPGNRGLWWGVWILGILLVWINFGVSYLPTPWGVLAAIPNLWFVQGLGIQLGVSFGLYLEALVVMMLVSYGIAILALMPAFEPLATILASGRFNGFVGMPLLFLALLHDHDAVKLALLVYGVGSFTTLSLVTMINDIRTKQQFRLDHSRTLRMGEWRVVWEVVVRGNLAETLDIMSVNAAMIWMMLPMVEGRFREGGIGALMEDNAKRFSYDAVFGALLIVLIVGIGLDWSIRKLRDISCPWGKLGVK